MQVFGRPRQAQRGSEAGSLQDVRERHAAAIAQRDQDDAGIEQAERERDTRVEELAAAFGLGKLDADEYEQQLALIEDQVQQAKAARARSGKVVEALAAHGERVIEEHRRRQLSLLDAGDQEDAAEESSLQAALARVAAARQTRAAKRRSVEAEASDALAQFSSSYASSLLARQRQADEAGRSVFKNYPSKRNAAAAAGDPLAIRMIEEEREHAQRVRRASEENLRAAGLGDLR